MDEEVIKAAIELSSEIDKEISSRARTLKDLYRILAADGQWNVNAYHHGLANGMELALSILENREPHLKPPPDKWLDNQSKPNPPHFRSLTPSSPGPF